MSATPVVARPPLARYVSGAHERTRRLRTAIAAGCLAAMVAAGAAMAVSGAAPHTSVVAAARHRLPGWIAGPLSPLAVHLTAAQFFIVFGGFAAAYLGVVALGSELRARWMLAAIVALHVLFVLTAPLLSTDVFNYVIYGRMGMLHGLDPYAVSPAHVAHDPVFRYIAWRHTRSAYGPLFTLGSYPLAALGPAGALWSLKAVAGAASLGCVALVWHLAKLRGVAATRAVAIFGLNPVLLVWTVAGAHNDLLMLLGVLGAIALVYASREALGGAALVAAVAVKASAGLALPFLLVGARRRWRAAAGVAAAAALTLAITLVAFSDHAAGLLLVLHHDQRMIAFDGVPRELAHLFGLRGETSAVRTAATVLMLAAIAWLVVRAIRGADWVAACGWAFCALVAGSSWILAWYTVWPLPLAAMTRSRRLLLAALALEAYFVVNHLPLFTQ